MSEKTNINNISTPIISRRPLPYLDRSDIKTSYGKYEYSIHMMCLEDVRMIHEGLVMMAGLCHEDKEKFTRIQGMIKSFEQPYFDHPNLETILTEHRIFG